MNDRLELPQGTLDLLILRTLALEPQHGWGISERVQQMSRDVLRIQQGSLYPALHRLERRGWIKARWASRLPGTREFGGASLAVLIQGKKGGRAPDPSRAGRGVGQPGRGLWAHRSRPFVWPAPAGATKPLRMGPATIVLSVHRFSRGEQSA